MDLRRLQLWMAVAEAGSFSKAAAALVISQATLSQQVAQLEAELGQRLLERHGRGVRLTDAGSALLVHARGIFELADRARADMQDRQHLQSGRITLGLPPSVAQVLSADLIVGFRDRFPAASISITEDLSIRLRELLVAGRLDFALLFDPPESPLLTLETLSREPLVLLSASPLPQRIRLADVARHALVMPSRPNALRQLLEREAGPKGLVLPVVAEVDSVQTVMSLVERGVGATVLPASALRQWRYEKAPRVAAIHGPVVRNRLVLAVPKARPATQLTRTAISLLRDGVARHYGADAG